MIVRCRRAKVSPGMVAWIDDLPSGDAAKPLPHGTRVIVGAVADSFAWVSAADREEVCKLEVAKVVRWEFEVSPGCWRDEGHPDVLALCEKLCGWLESTPPHLRVEADFAAQLARWKNMIERHSWRK